MRTLDGPWLLYDNEADPYQMNNFADNSEHATQQLELDALLQRKLDDRGDEFLPGMDYIRKWGYPTNKTGAVPFKR